MLTALRRIGRGAVPCRGLYALRDFDFISTQRGKKVRREDPTQRRQDAGRSRSLGGTQHFRLVQVASLKEASSLASLRPPRDDGTQRGKRSAQRLPPLRHRALRERFSPLLSASYLTSASKKHRREQPPPQPICPGAASVSPAISKGEVSAGTPCRRSSQGCMNSRYAPCSSGLMGSAEPGSILSGSTGTPFL